MLHTPGPAGSKLNGPAAGKPKISPVFVSVITQPLSLPLVAPDRVTAIGSATPSTQMVASVSPELSIAIAPASAIHGSKAETSRLEKAIKRNSARVLNCTLFKNNFVFIFISFFKMC